MLPPSPSRSSSHTSLRSGMPDVGSVMLGPAPFGIPIDLALEVTILFAPSPLRSPLMMPTTSVGLMIFDWRPDAFDV